ncbi:MAG: hypothetical protein ACM359_20695 [Bacillota bacterium]
MRQTFFESLESRQFLSISLPYASPLGSDYPTLTSTVQAAPTSPVISAVGNYSSSATFADEPGTIALKITSQKGTAVSGLLYSADWGGFNVTVSGTVDTKGRLTLKGSDKTFILKKFTAQIATNATTLTGSCSVVQMGIAATSKIQFNKLRKAPPVTPVVAPSLVGSYRGKAYNQDGNTSSISITVTRQDGGHIWAKNADGSSMTGVVLKDGRFRLVSNATDGHIEVTGQVQKKGVLRGDWTWTGTGQSHGQFDRGAFQLSRV